MSNIIPGRLYNVQNAADPLALLQHNMEVLAEDLYTLKPTPVGGTPNSLIGPPTTGDHVQGELWRDSLLALWRCESAGVPGDWRQVAPASVTALPGIEAPPQFTEGYQLATPFGLYAFLGDNWQPIARQQWLYTDPEEHQIAVESGGSTIEQTLASFVIPASVLSAGAIINLRTMIRSSTYEGSNQLRLQLGGALDALVLDQSSFTRDWILGISLNVLSVAETLVALLMYRTSGDSENSFYEGDLVSAILFQDTIIGGLSVAFAGSVSPPSEGIATLRLSGLFCRVA